MGGTQVVLGPVALGAPWGSGSSCWGLLEAVVVALGVCGWWGRVRVRRREKEGQGVGRGKAREHRSNSARERGTARGERNGKRENPGEWHGP